jgi:hypothetical protein
VASLKRPKLLSCLKVPKCEIFDRSDFPYFYTIKSSWVGDLVVPDAYAQGTHKFLMRMLSMF